MTVNNMPSEPGRCRHHGTFLISETRHDLAFVGRHVIDDILSLRDVGDDVITFSVDILSRTTNV